MNETKITSSQNDNGENQFHSASAANNLSDYHFLGPHN